MNSLGGLHKSQNILLALIKKGASRNEAYIMVQSSAMQSWNYTEEFNDILLNNKEIKKYLNEEELKDIFLNEDKVDNIDWIFENKI